MHLICTRAGKFAPEGQLRLQLAPGTECSFVCHVPGPRGNSLGYFFAPAGHRLNVFLELELELIQTQMAQKPMLRAEVGMRVRCANKASAE